MMDYDGIRVVTRIGLILSLILGIVFCCERLVVHVNNMTVNASEKTDVIPVEKSTRQRERIDNPTPFNENCIIADTAISTLSSVNQTDVQTAALYLYENTGCQLYIIGIDIMDYDISNYTDAYNIAKDFVAANVADQYAVSVVLSNKLVTGFDVNGNLQETQLWHEIFYGEKTGEVFDAEARRIFRNTLLNHVKSGYAVAVTEASNAVMSYTDVGGIVRNIIAIVVVGCIGASLYVSLYRFIRFRIRERDKKREHIEKVLATKLEPMELDDVEKYMFPEEQEASK